MRYFLFFILFNTGLNCIATVHSISIHTPEENLKKDITRLAIEDAVMLLKKACNCNVSINDSESSIILQLPQVGEPVPPSRFGKGVNYPYSFYPDHDYEWLISDSAGILIHQLSTVSLPGISNGIYGLLQEQLGFRFYHPKETFIPEISSWPLSAPFHWKAIARFDKKGFHLHTQHPLELTEQLLNEKYPNALSDVKEYLDWLARNGQNYFEFNLLESINYKTWPAHAKAFVDYGHSRGLLMGVDISLHMIQQKAFQLYQTPPKSFRSKRKQIEKNLAMLFTADWDYINMEFSSTEFTSGNLISKEKLRLFITDLVTNQYKSKLLGREHVVQKPIGSKKREYVFSAEEDALDKNRGILSHTVMFYTLLDEKAPVYENENLKHMFDFMMKENKVRETWYYPESAYWVTFDNSLPMTLLPYLSARLEDINLCDSLGIKGHVTFSSGWEWGYWLIDWSIARWSWKHETNGRPNPQYEPLSFVNELFKDPNMQNYFLKALDLQQKYIKEKELIRYLTSTSPTDELFAPLNKEFHPRPEFRYKEIRRKINLEQSNEIIENAVKPLHEFAQASLDIAREHESLKNNLDNTILLNLYEELHNGITITALRARHKAYTLEYNLQKRKNKILKTKTDVAFLLDNAQETREEALKIVRLTEKKYRYPAELISEKRKDYTCYHFGYLYPVHNLHFWFREEEQARNNRFGAFYMSIWNLSRTIGLID